MSRPATVNAINIHGANNLRRGFLDPIVKPLVDDENNAATTLGDVLGRLETVTTKLARFGRSHWILTGLRAAATCGRVPG